MCERQIQKDPFQTGSGVVLFVDLANHIRIYSPPFLEKRKAFEIAVDQPQPAKDETAEETLGALDPEFHLVDAEEPEKEKSYGEGSECGLQKLTRAQRKRLRKRKLKESASVRRKIIGPLVPSGYEDVGEAEQTDQQNKKA
ncbi:hypothetical protein QJS10_CPA05g01607 [Acorus calamus]|uniref:Uncharacterized protein n=1 Tax=Acorus calamus TaxID=4465 RepID=A0AAV9F0P8_ACOCL|nr:hypothetical protein QJS10_CPA05g01607 [Acorus calamus]